VRILRGFLKSDEFGLCGGQALRLQQQIVHVSITTAAAEQSFDVAVDGFHHTQGNVDAANKAGAVIEQAVDAVKSKDFVNVTAMESLAVSATD